MPDNQQAGLEYAPTGVERPEPVDDRILRQQQLRQDMEDFWRQNPENDPRLPVHEVPVPARGNQIGQLDPRVLKALEAARLPTIPTLALSKEFIGNALGRLASPLQPAKKILQGAPVESVTGQDVLQLGSVMVPGYGRAGASAVGAFGGGRSKVPAEILERYHSLAAQAERFATSINSMEMMKPTLPHHILKAHSDHIDKLRGMLKEQKDAMAELKRVMDTKYGKGWELGSAGGGPVGGKQITALISSLRGDREFEMEANRIFNELVDHYDDHVGPALATALANAKGIAELQQVIALAKSVSSGGLNEAAERAAAWNVYRKRLGTEDFELGSAGGRRRDRPGGFGSMPANPTPEDVKAFWELYDRASKSPGASNAMARAYGVSRQWIDAKLNDPRWKRPVRQWNQLPASQSKVSRGAPEK